MLQSAFKLVGREQHTCTKTNFVSAVEQAKQETVKIKEPFLKVQLNYLMGPKMSTR